MSQGDSTHKKAGIRRLISAARHQYSGVSHGLRTDPAIRQVGGAAVVLVLVSFILPVSVLERLALVLSTLLVLMVEFINSAIEAAVDRISTKRHPLSGHAKDLGSVAVAISVLMWAICWFVITGPHVLRWIDGP